MTKTYDIKRGAAIIATVKPEGYTSEQIMGDSSASLSFTLGSHINFLIGDTIRIDSVDFVLNRQPIVKKVSRIKFEYQLLFQGYKFELAKTAFLSLGTNNALKEVDFALMGNAAVFIDLIVANMNREHSGWTRGTVDVTDFKNLTFSEQNCLSALADLASQFNTEYWISGKTIHLTKKGVISGLNLEYGQGKGLYSISRSQPSDKNLFTRIIARGGSKNLPGTYRSGSTRLQLPGVLNYLERNVATYGIIEVTRTYDEIYPKREGTVTGVGNELIFLDTGIDFDLNAQLISGVTAKVVFNTGQLAGYEFDISSYNHVTKTVVINFNKDEKAIQVPSALIKAAIGDKYVFTDIIMPASYIAAAEIELQAKAQADLNQNSDPWAEYQLDPDPLYFKRQNIVLTLGDYVHLLDTDLGINENIRVIGYQKDLQDYYKYTAIELATVVAISSIVKQYSELENTQRAVSFNRLTDAARARRNYKTTQELQGLIFDADGYFTNKIKPLSIETAMISVGAKSQQFVLNGVIFSPNFTASQAKFRSTAGTLDHFSLTDTIRSWTLAAYSNDTLLDATAYYIYAKCDKGGATGNILLTTSQITVSQDAAFYHFLIGVLHSPIDGVRGVSLTYGQTTINGKFITTGRIQGAGGLFIDLDTGEQSGKFTFTAGSSGYNNLTDKPNLAAYATIAGLGTLAFDSVVEVAKLGTTVIEGGYIKSTLLNVNAIIVSGSLETTSGAQTKANTAQSNAASDATSKANAAQSAAASDATTKAINAQNAAIASAGSDATTKANAAQSAAISSAATDATTKANNAQSAAIADATSRVTTLQNSLGSLAYDSLVTFAKLDSTIIVGGYIKTTLLDVNAIIVNGAISTQTDAQSRANAAQSAAISSAATDATTKANAATAVANTAQTSANNAQASANSANALLTDIASDSKLTPGEKQLVKKEWDIIVGENAPIIAQANTYSVSTAAFTNAYNALSTYITPLLTDLTITNDIIGNTFRTTFKNYYDARTALLKAVTDAAKTLADQASTSAATAQTAANGAQTSANSAQTSANNAQSSVTTLQNSLGSLAYDSLVELSKLGTTIIQGGYIKTTLLDAAFIKSDIINTTYLNSLSIVARNIATYDSGKRVEINGTNNNIRLYDSLANVLIEIDDDSALEDRINYPNAVPPFYENVYGPGIRVGISGAQTGSLSRRGLSTTTPAGAIQQFVGADSSNAGKVQLDIAAGMTLSNVSNANFPGNATYFKNLKVYYDTDINGFNILSWIQI